MLTQSSTRGLTVSSLMKNSNRFIVQNIVQDQMRIIDAKISTAHQSGFDSITHELPVNFNINNMDKSESQTLIYSELISIYSTPERDGGKGFTNISIEGGATKTTLYIQWINGMDEKEKEQRQKIIRDHMIRKK
jgi:hypothetical protein